MELLTLKDAFRYCGLSIPTLRKYMIVGKLTKYRQGERKILVDRDELDALIKKEG